MKLDLYAVAQYVYRFNSRPVIEQIDNTKASRI